MNKYAAHGLVAAAHNGRRVIVVSATTRHAEQAMYDFMQPAEDAGAVIARTNGARRIDFPTTGGQIYFASAQTTAERGRSVDVVFLDGENLGAHEYDLIDRYRPCIGTSRVGEIVRA